MNEGEAFRNHDEAKGQIPILYKSIILKAEYGVPCITEFHDRARMELAYSLEKETQHLIIF